MIATCHPDTFAFPQVLVRVPRCKSPDYLHLSHWHAHTFVPGAQPVPRDLFHLCHWLLRLVIRKDVAFSPALNGQSSVQISAVSRACVFHLGARDAKDGLHLASLHPRGIVATFSRSCNRTPVHQCYGTARGGGHQSPVLCLAPPPCIRATRPMHEDRKSYFHSPCSPL